MSWETPMLLVVQRRTAGSRTLPVARLLGRAGEHAAAWIAAGLVGAVPDSRVAWPRLSLGVHHIPGVLAGVALGSAVAAATPVERTGHGR